MAQAFAQVELPASPDEVWQLIGGFNSLPDWLPYIPSSELSEGGRVRTLANPDGDAIVERLEKFDNAERTYSYSFINSPFPVSTYLATIRVLPEDGGHGSRVQWSSEFTPEGISDAEAGGIFEGIYDLGLQSLAKRFAADR